MTTTGIKSGRSWKDFGRVAGPDDPIYQSGVNMTFVRRPKVSSLTGQEMKAIVERLRRDPKYKQ
jgi:hypothetical protein